MQPRQRKAKMANSRRSDFGEEFVERLRKDRFRKAYILVNGLSSGEEEEDEEELCFEDEDDEIASYAMDSSHRPPSVHSSRRPPSIAHSQRAGGAFGFDARDLYFFGVLSELTDKFTPERTARFIAKNPPPADFRSLGPNERIAYLLYFSLYGRYLSVGKFHNVFNREFFKYTSAGDSERVAFLKICRLTLEEYKRRALEQNKRAYKLSQKHLFSDGRATPDSRMSDRPSMESEDLNSIDSLTKELMFHRSPHAPVRFGRGGRIIYVDPTSSVSTVCVEDLKRFFKDTEGRRYVEMLETFKGPLLGGHTPPQTPLLFIQCQIDRLLQSDVYRANPSSCDANDCLLIWSLLEILIRQHGKVTGPDLARLLCSNQTKHLAVTHKSFLKSDDEFVRSTSAVSRQNSADTESSTASSALERVMRFLLGGHVDEAIESAIADGLLFDALLLAHRLFLNDRNRLDAIETRLMAHRSPQHPITTLLSVAADQPVPLLSNPTTYETNGWRSHIAIVLANLQSPTAMSAVYQLGLALAQKEFNSAADFCFLAVNLLSGFDCFQQQSENDGHQRKFIRLINATLPDDETNSSLTRFGWSILDYQATELFDYALQLVNPNSQTLLSNSNCYVKARLQYAQLLDELGGFKNAVELYRSDTSDHSKTPSPPPQPSAIPKSQFVQPQHPKTQLRGALTSSTHQPTRSPPKSLPGQSSVRTSIASQGEREELPSRRSRSPSPTVTLTHSPPNVSSIHAFMANPRTSESDEVGVFAEKANSQNNAQLQPPFLLPIPPFYNVGTIQNADANVQQPREMEAVNVADGDLRQMPPLKRPSVSSTSDKLSSSANPNGPKSVAAPLPNSTGHKNQEEFNNEKVTASADEKNEGSGGGGKGFLRGFFSKIKVPVDSNEMKLPEDKDPKIVWDPRLGRYVDQEQNQQPPEELAPPPIIPTYQPQQWHTAQSQEQQQHQVPTASRAFQGKSRS
uniref:Ancestral coatomer element 1 Sec16/Sec31 domain-containing protein n=1 Tax=Globodera rostochiensis TaxID=31243 RepID=A0A914GU76_GLORO